MTIPTTSGTRIVLEVLRYVDSLFPNEREVKKLTRADDLAQAASILAGLAKVVFLKRGPEAAICPEVRRWSLTPAVQAVDTVGAGDSFSAGFLH